MYIKVSNLKDGTSKWYDDVDKVIFHSDQGNTEYDNVNCINHDAPSNAFSIFTPVTEAGFATSVWYIAKAIQ